MDVLGIDLAKLTFDATLLTASGQQHYQSFPNSPEGFTQLQAWLSQHGVTQLHACMEATNIYWEALATWTCPRVHSERGQPGPHQRLCSGDHAAQQDRQAR